MRRIALALSFSFAALLTAAPVLAATPEASRIRESATVQIAWATQTTCATTTCFETYVEASVTDPDSGPPILQVCVSLITMSIHGKAVSAQTAGCGTPSSLTFARDSSRATVGATTLAAETCTRFGCDPASITVSGSFSATGAFVPFDDRLVVDHGTCIERFTIRGTRAPSVFNGSVNGADVTASSMSGIGQERSTYSTSC